MYIGKKAETLSYKMTLYVLLEFPPETAYFQRLSKRNFIPWPDTDADSHSA